MPTPAARARPVRPFERHLRATTPRLPGRTERADDVARRDGAVARLADAVERADAERVARLLRTVGAHAVTSGGADVVRRAAGSLTEPDAEAVRLAAWACEVLGDWDRALAWLDGHPSPAQPAVAVRRATVHYLRGETAAAIAVASGADPSLGSDADRAHLHALRASARWVTGDLEGGEVDAAAALRDAQAAAEPGAVAAAHTVLAMVAAQRGDRAANERHDEQALRAAEDAGDLVQLARIRNNRGSHRMEEGDYREALAELEAAVRLADRSGHLLYGVAARTNLGETRLRLGELAAAQAHAAAALRAAQRLGSHLLARPLMVVADGHRERGETHLAIARYREAAEHATAAGDRQHLALALAGGALAVVGEDAPRAAGLAERACRVASAQARPAALVALGWARFHGGDLAAAGDLAAQAAAAAAEQRDHAEVARATVLAGYCATDGDAAVADLSTAHDAWARLGNPLERDRCAVALGRLEPGPAGRYLATEAGIRISGSGGAPTAATPVAAVADGDPGVGIEIVTMGRFEVRRDGEVVGPGAWGSRKARDLLRILAARQGRPVRREYLMAQLWPDEDPAKLGNRLAVALATVRRVLEPSDGGRPADADPSVPAVVTDGDRVGLDLAVVTVDVDRFLGDAARALSADAASPLGWARLVTAERSWAGDPFEEHPDAEWAADVRDRARVTYFAVASAVVRGALDRGDHDLAAAVATRLLAVDPYDERAHLTLIRIHHEAGRRGEAARWERRYRDRLAELGLVPEREGPR